MATSTSRTKWNGNIHQTKNLPEKGALFTLNYEGKLSEEEILNTDSSSSLVLWKGNPSPNSLYFGDNLPILSALLNNPNVIGKVKLVYIDPPFSTGGVFHSRSQKDAYTDLLTGAAYIEFIRRRLIFLRELLDKDGSIYVHLDHNMAPYIKVIMDEVFGASNFINWITRKKSNPKNYTRKTYGNISDVILFYSKSSYYVWNRPLVQWDAEAATKEYNYIEEITGRRYKKVPIHAPGTRNGDTGKPWRGKLPPPGKHWQFIPQTLDEMDARGEIFWSQNGNPRRKLYLDQNIGKQVQDIWLDFRDAFNQNNLITGYPTEKNQELLDLIVRTSSNEGDLVLDCFSGSGTTLAAASNLGRRWIGVDNSPEAIFTTLKRFIFGTEPMGDFVRGKKAASQKKLFTISDFSLFATEPYNGKIDNTLVEWKEWIGE